MESSSKLLRCMILSTTQESSEEFARWLTGTEGKEGLYVTSINGVDIMSYCRWPNCPKGLPGAPA